MGVPDPKGQGVAGRKPVIPCLLTVGPRTTELSPFLQGEL